MQAMADLYASHPFWVWAALGAALLAVEVATSTGWLLWPAASAVVVGLLTVVAPGLTLPYELMVFALVTIASTLLARRYFPKSAVAHGHDINDNVSRLMGHEGETVQAFSGRVGRVFIDGKEWAAELEGGERLARGERVKVVGVRGSVLQVRPAR